LKAAKRYSESHKLNLLVYVNFPAYEQQYEAIRTECEEAAASFGSVWLLNGNAICCIKGSDVFPPTKGWMFIEESLARPD
jgi:hypothetical protein